MIYLFSKSISSQIPFFEHILLQPLQHSEDTPAVNLKLIRECLVSHFVSGRRWLAKVSTRPELTTRKE